MLKILFGWFSKPTYQFSILDEIVIMLELLAVVFIIGLIDVTIEEIKERKKK